MHAANEAWNQSLVWIGSLLVTVFAIGNPTVFTVAVAVWLWFTVLFAKIVDQISGQGSHGLSEVLLRLCVGVEQQRQCVRRSDRHQGTLPTTGPLFATLLAGSIVLVAALTFVPALALGPIAEALL